MCGPIRLAHTEVRRRTLFAGLCGTPGGRGSRPSYMEPLLELLLNPPPLRIQTC